MMTGGGQMTGQNHLTCTATIKPSMFNYAVAGDTLTISDPTNANPPVHGSRIAPGAAGRDVYGLWFLLKQPITDLPGAEVALNLKVEPDRVAAVVQCTTPHGSKTAEAASPATITDASITTLENHEDDQVITW